MEHKNITWNTDELPDTITKETRTPGDERFEMGNAIKYQGLGLGLDVGCIAQAGLDEQHAHLQGQITEEAEKEGLGPLSLKQWAVIQFVLDYHMLYESAPPAVRIGRAIGLSPRQLDELFPAGAARTAFRLAGMQLPEDALFVGSSSVTWN